MAGSQLAAWFRVAMETGPKAARFEPVASLTSKRTECAPSGSVAVSSEIVAAADPRHGTGVVNGRRQRPPLLSTPCVTAARPSTSIVAW